MTNLQPAHGGAFLVNAAAAADPACQAAMAGYLDELKREAKRRDAIRNGTAQMFQSVTINISDRD